MPSCRVFVFVVHFDGSFEIRTCDESRYRNARRKWGLLVVAGAPPTVAHLHKHFVPVDIPLLYNSRTPTITLPLHNIWVPAYRDSNLLEVL